MARRELTDSMVAALKPKSKRYTVADPKLPGHYVRVASTGHKSFVAVARSPSGKQGWHTVGPTYLYKVEESRELARTAIKAIKGGEDHAPPQTFAEVAGEWLERHVDKKGLLSAGNTKGYLEKHVLPVWGELSFQSIRRGDVAKLLDGIEDNAGPAAADFTLSVVRSICNWYAARHEGYASPIVRGMRRSNPKERARDRKLNDDELRAMWRRAEANGSFGALVRLLLLTGQRREKVSAMRWEDIGEDGVWRIPSEAREKGTAGELLLPQAALEIIRAQPRFAGNPHVFANTNGGYIANYSRGKRRFIKDLPAMPQWGLHDLRRTARSLMSRAGVRPDIAERVMGHAIQALKASTTGTNISRRRPMRSRRWRG